MRMGAWSMARVLRQRIEYYIYINSIRYFNSNVFNFCNTRTYHSHSLSLIPPFSRTNSYFHSFVPNTIYMWNMLDMSVVSAPSLHHFKSLL